MNRHRIIANADSAGQRLDAFVAAFVPDLSRSQAKRLIDDGLVSVNGVSSKASRTVAAGDAICVEVPPPVVPSAIPQSIPLDILYEDNDLIVVNKPAGMVVHPAAGHPDGTLVNALLFHCKDLSGVGGELKAGIVHRLDLGTSGAIVCAKNDRAHRAVAAQFAARTVTKIYVALVVGSMRNDSGTIDTPIGRSRNDRKRMSSRTKKGRASLTEWRVEERFGKEFSWLKIRLRTGRMHQIRVHLSEAGHPLVGDSVYGGAQKASRFKDPRIRALVAAFKRPALHSARLEFDHPTSGNRIICEAPLPADISELKNAIAQIVGEKR